MTRYKVRVTIGPDFDQGIGVIVEADSETEAATLGLDAAARELPSPYVTRLYDVTAVE